MVVVDSEESGQENMVVEAALCGSLPVVDVDTTLDGGRECLEIVVVTSWLDLGVCLMPADLDASGCRQYSSSLGQGQMVLQPESSALSSGLV